MEVPTARVGADAFVRPASEASRPRVKVRREKHPGRMRPGLRDFKLRHRCHFLT